jgi:hypothetical protein
MRRPPMPDCYDYVRSYYGVPAYIGARVRIDGREGVLVRSTSGHWALTPSRASSTSSTHPRRPHDPPRRYRHPPATLRVLRRPERLRGPLPLLPTPAAAEARVRAAAGAAVRRCAQGAPRQGPRRHHARGRTGGAVVSPAPPHFCPVCHATRKLPVRSEVLKTRQLRGAIWRRRRCPQCGHRWSSYETTISPSDLRHARPADRVAP